MTGILLFAMALICVACPGGAHRARPGGSAEADRSTFLNPAIAGSIQALTASYYGLLIARALGTDDANFPHEISYCARLDSLLGLGPLPSRKSEFGRVSPIVDSIDIAVFRNGIPAGAVAIRGFAGAFVDLGEGVDCDTTEAEGELVILAGEFELFGEPVRVRRGAMRFARAICGGCGRDLAVLSERDAEGGDPVVEGHRRGAAADAGRLGLSDGYAYLVTRTEVAYAGGAMSAGFTARSVFGAAADLDSVWSVATVFLSLGLELEGHAFGRQESIALIFDSQQHLMSADRRLPDLLR